MSTETTTEDIFMAVRLAAAKLRDEPTFSPIPGFAGTLATTWECTAAEMYRRCAEEKDLQNLDGTTVREVVDETGTPHAGWTAVLKLARLYRDGQASPAAADTAQAGPDLARRRAAEFLADEARDASALPILAQYAHLNGWDELDGMTGAEAAAHLAAVHEAATAATITSTWADGTSETVAPVAAQPETAFALSFTNGGPEWTLREVHGLTFVAPAHTALSHLPCAPDIERGSGHYLVDQASLFRLRQLAPAEIQEMDAKEGQREQDHEGMYASGQLDDAAGGDAYTPDPELVKELAARVTDAYGKHARLPEIGHLATSGWIPEADALDDGQIEELFDEVRNELAARDNGRRR